MDNLRFASYYSLISGRGARLIIDSIENNTAGHKPAPYDLTGWISLETRNEDGTAGLCSFENLPLKGIPNREPFYNTFSREWLVLPPGSPLSNIEHFLTRFVRFERAAKHYGFKGEEIEEYEFMVELLLKGINTLDKHDPAVIDISCRDRRASKPPIVLYLNPDMTVDWEHRLKEKLLISKVQEDYRKLKKLEGLSRKYLDEEISNDITKAIESLSNLREFYVKHPKKAQEES